MTQLTPLIVRHNQTELPFRSDMLAADMDNKLQLLSCVGSGVAIRALAAGLRLGGSVEFLASGITYNCIRAADKYRFRYAKLGLDTWHLLAIADDPRLLLELTDASLWQLISSDEFTTPVMRHWVPWIRTAMSEGIRGALRELPHVHNCRPYRCYAGDSSLDSIVRYGVQHGHLKFQPEGEDR
jgi:hypothetical protein